MRQAAANACQFIEGWKPSDFSGDVRTQQAVIMSIVIIGEAAAKIESRYPAFVAEHSEIPWKAMRGMRNRIAHGYFELDLNAVWDTAREELPRLVKRLEALQEKEKSRD